MTPLNFPEVSFDAWAQTAPMALAGDSVDADRIPACPWGFEMMGTECAVHHGDGRHLTGQLVQWDPSNNRCIFRAAPDYAETLLPLTRLHRVTLTRALPPGANHGAFGGGDAAEAAGPVAYRLELDDGTVLQDVALHRVERPEGHYLARRVSAAGAVERLFVPARALRRAEFQPLTDAPAALRPVAAAPVSAPAGALPASPPSAAPVLRLEPVTTPRALCQAIALQASLPVRPLGDILVSLELISVEQLATTLSAGRGNGALPLGERLVRLGLVTPEGLQRALHMKMNYPVVDLRRFAFDAELLRRLPYERAVELDVLPLARTEDGRVVVALDDPGRLPTLHSLRLLFDAPLVVAMPWTDPVRRMVPVAYGVRDVAGSGVGWFG